MMHRLGLSARLLAIGFSALIVMWLVILVIHYRGTAVADTNPQPSRLAALVRLLDSVPATERATVLTASTSPSLALEILPADASGQDALAGDDLSDGEALAGYGQRLGERLLSISAVERGAVRAWQAERQGVLAVPLEFRLRLADGSILVARSRLPYASNAKGLPVGLGAGLVGTLIALAILILVQREIRPLTRLALAADQMDPSGPPIPLPPVSGRTGEVRSLIQAFGRLQDRLQLLLTSRLALLSGVQHDVRSFATRLRLRVEAIPDPGERERAVKDIEDMIRLLDDALISARAGSGSLDEELIDLGEWVSGEVGDLRRNGLAVSLGSMPEGTLEVLADRLAIKRILGNLVDNAVKYGSRAEVGLRRTGEEAIIAVRDGGPGIPEEMRALLLEPFTRGEPSRARNTGGAGLGLAIVQTLARAHGGTVEITDAPGGGAEVRVHLPLFGSYSAAA